MSFALQAVAAHCKTDMPKRSKRTEAVATLKTSGSGDVGIGHDSIVFFPFLVLRAPDLRLKLPSGNPRGINKWAVFSVLLLVYLCVMSGSIYDILQVACIKSCHSFDESSVFFFVMPNRSE
eukprot:SAG11_NODE_1085_length_5939_cov_9.908390_4_plen_121_part_00